MRRSKYDQSSLPMQDGKDVDKDDNISEIENRVEFDTELVNLANQIEDIKAVIQDLRQVKTFVDGSVSTFEEAAQALKAAEKASNNISDAICRTFMQIENTVITVKLSEEDKSILAESRHKLIEEEKSLFEKQIIELKTLHINHWRDVQKLIKSEAGFYFIGWFAKVIGVSYLVLYIACIIMFFLLIK